MSENKPVVYRVCVQSPAHFGPRVWRGLAESMKQAEEKAQQAAERACVRAGMDAEICLVEILWSEEAGE